MLLVGGPMTAQEPSCPEPTMTLEDLQARFLELAAEGRERSARGYTLAAVAPRGQPPSCPILREELDRQEALDALIRWLAVEEVGPLRSPVLGAIRTALQVNPPPAPPDFPGRAVRFAVENPPDPIPFVTLTHFAASDYPQAHAFLISLVRAERGPISHPDLPAGLAEAIFRFPSERDADLRAKLESAPELIRNPRARCLIVEEDFRSHEPRRCPEGGIP